MVETNVHLVTALEKERERAFQKTVSLEIKTVTCYIFRAFLAKSPTGLLDNIIPALSVPSSHNAACSV